MFQSKLGTVAFVAFLTSMGIAAAGCSVSVAPAEPIVDGGAAPRPSPTPAPTPPTDGGTVVDDAAPSPTPAATEVLGAWKTEEFSRPAMSAGIKSYEPSFAMTFTFSADGKVAMTSTGTRLEGGKFGGCQEQRTATGTFTTSTDAPKYLSTTLASGTRVTTNCKDAADNGTFPMTNETGVDLVEAGVVASGKYTISGATMSVVFGFTGKETTVAFTKQ